VCLAGTRSGARISGAGDSISMAIVPDARGPALELDLVAI
jgi:hypothetical protein